MSGRHNSSPLKEKTIRWQKELTKRQARYINRLMPFQVSIEYRKGSDNIADALSRHAIQQLAVSSITTDVDWPQACLRDPEFAAIYQRPAEYAEQGFVKRNNVLYRRHRICVPESMVDKLLRTYRDETN
ncbi:hypothetical protein NDN08_003269 [Rhodosorus marinus]|uniref:Uncharacterized protein n=1 Tax=Rhodosorus marinus TaxID=101924 RepID=A0AAV8UW09_9RHOD|nr:hypothetical protein NDN08_003269 [Rhodosorus marinus]